MVLIFGIIEGEYKPQLFECEKVRINDWDLELLTKVNGKKVAVRPVSTPFRMESYELGNLMNHYGLAEYYNIIGRRKCEEILYEASV